MGFIPSAVVVEVEKNLPFSLLSISRSYLLYFFNIFLFYDMDFLQLHVLGIGGVVEVRSVED